MAASTQDGTLAPLSNYGDWVDVVAPGFNIYSTLPDNSYGYKSGTSFAAAHVSGLAALLCGVVTDTNGNGRINDEVRVVIESSLCRLT
jgi:subtilisin family serine protease